MKTFPSSHRFIASLPGLVVGLTAGALLTASTPSSGFAGQFAVMTYNVHGLPPIPFITPDRESEMRKIAEKLEDFHTPEPPYVGIAAVVGLQEVFYDHYYDILT
ncbi:MAG: hypothetical protein ABIS29_13160, partial [Vicinamibacterales bacterium]